MTTELTFPLMNLINIVYRYPAKRSFWLSVWYSSIEKVEEENPWALAFDEEEETLNQ